LALDSNSSVRLIVVTVAGFEFERPSKHADQLDGRLAVSAEDGG
jgi:hypothetical protein